MGLIQDINYRIDQNKMLPSSIKERLNTGCRNVEFDSINSRNYRSFLFEDNPAEITHLSARPIRDVILNWVVESMPEIADYYNTPHIQVWDSIQHYRFGFIQADKLWGASPDLQEITEDDKKYIALFTCVHDIGRLMVGGGASKNMYPVNDEGYILHPVIGAAMLREAFVPIMGDGAGADDLLSSLISVTERHRLSVGMTGSEIERANIRDITGYENCERLMLYDAMSTKGNNNPRGTRNPFSVYAHIVAMADLINNVDAVLTGATQYKTNDGLERIMTSEYSIDPIIGYIINGPGNGSFSVIGTDDTEDEVHVNRFWKNGTEISKANWQSVLSTMLKQAVRSKAGNEAKQVELSFWNGVGNLRK